MSELAVIVVGHDRPGIVADVAEVLSGLGANLTDSTMTLLRGHFAMTLICTGPAADEVEAALAPLSAGGRLLATVRAVEPEDTETVTGAPLSLPVRLASSPYVLTVHGADRLGIVAAVTRVLADAGGNITDLTTRLSGTLYLLVAEVDLPAGAVRPVTARLDEVAGELGVEVTLRPNESDLL